jgi:hypothetical protein
MSSKSYSILSSSGILLHCRFDLDFHHPTEIFAQVIIKEFTVRQKVYEILSGF